MAEEIVQRLGFDTGDSISNIEALKNALESLNTSITASTNAIKSFSTAGGGFDKALSDLSGKIDQLSQKVETGFSNIKPPQITFDTSAALSQITQLTNAWGRISTNAPATFKQQFASMKASLADFVAQNNLTKTQVIQAFAGTLSGVSPSINGLKAKVAELKTTFSSMAESAQSSGSKIGNFISYAARIMAFRALISTVNDFTQALTESVQSASEFSMRIGQIGAIMDDTTLSLGKIREQLLQISSEFARPLSEVSIGFYQTLQNQVGNAAESMKVFQASAKLAAANNASVKDSVDLMTAAIKGWNLSTEDAGRLAGMFFEAIKIGRMEAADMANVLGKIGPQAHAMGVSIEETMAIIAIMTQQGTKFNTASTQMSAFLTALMKPTKDLKAAMKDMWGVDSGEQAIALFGGVLPLLQQLGKLSGGNTAEMAKFTANVRAMRTELAISGENANAAANALDQLKRATEETATIASKKVLETPGGEYKRSVEELANAWTKAGEKLLWISTLSNQLKTSLVEWLTSSTGQTIMFSAAVITLVAAVRNFTPVILTAAMATKRFFAAVGLTNPFVAMFTAGVLIGTAINEMWDRAEARMKAYYKSVADQSEQAAAAVKKAINDETNASIAADKKRETSMLQVAAEVRKRYQPELEAVKRTQEAIYTVTKHRFDSIITAQQGYITKLMTAEQEAAAKIIALQQSIAQRKMSISDREFELRISKLSKEDQAAKEYFRAEQIRAEALSKIQTAKTPEDVKIIEELLGRAQEYYNKVASIANEESLIRHAKEKSIQVDKDKVSLEEKQINLLKQEGKSRTDQIASASKLLQDTTALFKQYEDGLKKIGKAKTPEDAKKAAQDMMSAWQGIMEIATKQSPQAKDFLGLGQIHNEIMAQLQDLPELHLKTVVDLENLNKQLQKPFEGLSDQMKKLLGEEGKLDIGSAMESKISKWTEELAQVKKALSDIQTATATVRTGFEEAGHKLPNGKSLDDLAQAETSIQPGLEILKDKLTELSKISPFDVDATKAKVAEIKETIEQLKTVANISGAPEGFDALAKNMEQAVKDAFSALSNTPIQQDIDVQLKNKEQLQNNLDSIRAQLANLAGGGVAASNAIATMTSSLTNVTPNVTPIGEAFNNNVTPAINASAAACGQLQNAAANALMVIREMAAAAAQAASMGGTLGFARGGTVYRANGGMIPRWTDTIPAMLSPYEVIMNSAASTKFAPQLQAMNAGKTPIFRDRGGSVTTVGDINVTVQGGDTSQQTLESIGRGLQRMVRRKTLKLN
jgi:TP901 family phage tail tape measure protein